MKRMRISDLARASATSASAIRYYERIGLLPEADREYGQRRYDAEVLGRLGFIGVAQGAGFKLAEIKALIDGVDSDAGMADQMRVLASRKLEEVEALLERTKAMKGWLAVASECGCASPAECALFPESGEPALVHVAGRDCRRGSASAQRAG